MPRLGESHFCLQPPQLPAKMKRRVTFIQPPDAPFEPHQATLTASTLSLRDLDAAREDRLTFGLDALPEEVSMTCQEIRECTELMKFHFRSSSAMFLLNPTNSTSAGPPNSPSTLSHRSRAESPPVYMCTTLPSWRINHRE